jgi:uncharacterized protein (DUF924 family)
VKALDFSIKDKASSPASFNFSDVPSTIMDIFYFAAANMIASTLSRRRTFTTLSSLRLFSTVATALTVTDMMTSKPFVKRALESPDSPSSVLTFFYGVDYEDQEEYKKQMRQGTPLKEMGDLWYGGGDEYDRMCQTFIPVIRSVVGDPDKLQKKPEEYTKWSSSVDNVMSQVLLCDQLSRNAFRGKDEAFQYDSLGEKHIQQLVEDYLKHDPVKQSLPGEFYPGYLSFMVTGLMHSEDLRNHDLASRVLEAGVEEYKDQEIVVNTLKFQERFLNDHRKVVEKFGRYPHRNAKKGRENTPEEQAWLDDEEKLPGWAKSQ